MIYRLLLILTLTVYMSSCATSQVTATVKEVQAESHFSQIPAYPESYTTGTVLGRLVDALGFRYYWATEGLREEDRAYEPGGGNRSAQNVLEHLHGLSETIVNAPAGLPNVRPSVDAPKTWEELRQRTLDNLKKASELLKASDSESVSTYKVTFQRGEKTSDFNYWHMINGPITDAIYHVGQITSYRRSSGNPVNPTVNVFMGTAEN